MIRFFGFLVQLAVLSLSVVILFSLLSPVLPLADSVGHFRLHLTLVLIGPTVLILLLGKRRWAIFSTCAIVASVFSMQPAIQWPLTLQVSPKTATLRLLQLNINYANRQHEALINLVKEEQPDVLTLQEVERNGTRLLHALRDEYPHQHRCAYRRVGDVAVLTKRGLPFLQTHCYAVSGYGWVEVLHQNRKLKIGTLHLHWPYPHRQPEQVREISAYLAKLKGPIIIAGDFNASPWSHSVHSIGEAVGSAAIGGLRITQYTYLRDLPPIPLQIDHVLIPKGARGSIRVGKDVGSDHLPLIAEIAL